jgi:hypothetical protein
MQTENNIRYIVKQIEESEQVQDGTTVALELVAAWKALKWVLDEADEPTSHKLDVLLMI